MKKFTVIFLLFSIFLCAISLGYLVKRRNSYIRDLEFIYDTIKENHPGIYNKLDPNFKQNMYCQHLSAKRSLRFCLSFRKYRKILSSFVRSFNDSHLGIFWKGDARCCEILRGESGVKPKAGFTDTKMAWIILPTFLLDDEARKGFPKFLESLVRARDCQIIVFDLRGNGGGDSTLGNDVLEAIFGKDYVEDKLEDAYSKVFVDYRASKGNLDHLQKLYDRFGDSWMKIVSDGVKRSVQLGVPYYRYSHQNSGISRDNLNKSKTNYKKPSNSVYIITNSKNGSAALDFIDTVKTLDLNSTIVGETTGSDRLYMEIRIVSLPSGRGDFGFPIKVYRNRIRKDNEPYIPDIKCDPKNTNLIKKIISDCENKNKT